MTAATPNTPPEYQPHIGASRQYMRDIILGVNDGLVSTFLLVAGVVGGGLDTTQVLLTGVAGGIAGMVSMAIGEYLATKSQDEVFDAEIALEREHLEHHREHERAQLVDMLADMGLEGTDLETVVEIIDSNDEAMLNMQGALEFGIVDKERRSPFAAGITSGFLFFAGALPSVLPFLFFDNPGQGLFAAAVLSGIGLFAVGAIKTAATRKNPFISGAENLALGLLGGAIAYAIGTLVRRTGIGAKETSDLRSQIVALSSVLCRLSSAGLEVEALAGGETPVEGVFDLLHLGHRVSGIDKRLVSVSTGHDDVYALGPARNCGDYVVSIDPTEGHRIGSLVEDHEVVLA